MQNTPLYMQNAPTRNVHRCDRVVDELQYVGIARREGEYLVSCNQLYAEVARLFVPPPAKTELERTVWPLIEQAEVGLRRLVRAAYSEKWGPQADANIQQVIRGDAWDKVLENREKYLKRPRGNPQKVVAEEVLNFMYLGQLGELMLCNKAWQLFKHLFHGKYELEEMIRDIKPVRDDLAHFRPVTDHELNRCGVRCTDLLNILERNQQVTRKAN